jgi:hypothetical protein
MGIVLFGVRILAGDVRQSERLPEHRGRLHCLIPTTVAYFCEGVGNSDLRTTSHPGDAAMPLVRMKEKGQVTLPAKIRERRDRKSVV